MLRDSDISQATKALSAMANLEFKMNTDIHLASATRAAFEIMSNAFDEEVDALAYSDTAKLGHVYEPGFIGMPGMRLWRNKLGGRGGTREISWTWKASRLAVDPLIGPSGKPRFVRAQQSDKFHPEKLQKIHVFIWKAPVMEYGTPVVVRPRLAKFLIFPNEDATGGRSGIPGASFSSSGYSFSPGRASGAAGNFTATFEAWWGGGPGQAVLDEVFTPQSNRSFKTAFSKELRGHGVGKITNKYATVSINSGAAKEGEFIADLIAGEVRKTYTTIVERGRNTRFGAEDREDG